jgi:co-chaperonin GroES (HSP10)
MKIRLRAGKYLLRPLDPLPRGGPQPSKLGFTSGENKKEMLPRWKVVAAPSIGERQHGKEYPAQFREGETVILMNRITQEDFDALQILPGFEGEKKVIICDENNILGAIEQE